MQLDAYLSILHLETGWLVIFDRRQGLPPIAQRLDTEIALSLEGHEIQVIRA